MHHLESSYHFGVILMALDKFFQWSMECITVKLLSSLVTSQAKEAQYIEAYQDPCQQIWDDDQLLIEDYHWWRKVALSLGLVFSKAEEGKRGHEYDQKHTHFFFNLQACVLWIYFGGETVNARVRLQCFEMSEGQLWSKSNWVLYHDTAPAHTAFPSLQSLVSFLAAATRLSRLYLLYFAHVTFCIFSNINLKLNAHCLDSK